MPNQRKPGLTSLGGFVSGEVVSKLAKSGINRADAIEAGALILLLESGELSLGDVRAMRAKDEIRNGAWTLVERHVKSTAPALANGQARHVLQVLDHARYELEQAVSPLARKALLGSDALIQRAHRAVQAALPKHHR